MEEYSEYGQPEGGDTVVELLQAVEENKRGVEGGWKVV